MSTAANANNVRHISPQKKPSLPSWGTEDPNYSVDRFYTRGSDGKGNSEAVRARFAPEVIARLHRVVQQGRIPEYRTVADIIRDAVVHRLQYLDNEYMEDGHKSSLTLAMGGFHAAKQRDAMQKDAIEDIRTSLSAAKKEENWQLYEELKTWAWDTVDGMDDWYAQRAVRTIKEVEREEVRHEERTR